MKREKNCNSYRLARNDYFNYSWFNGYDYSILMYVDVSDLIFQLRKYNYTVTLVDILSLSTIKKIKNPGYYASKSYDFVLSSLMTKDIDPLMLLLINRRMDYRHNLPYLLSYGAQRRYYYDEIKRRYNYHQCQLKAEKSVVRTRLYSKKQKLPDVFYMNMDTMFGKVR